MAVPAERIVIVVTSPAESTRMPVTAKLSRKFYDRFGDELTNELVEWFNLVDATYRGDLRELNELNFARFDAKLEQRVAQLDAKLERRLTQLEQRIVELRADLRTEFAAGLTSLEGRLTRRLFGFWITQAATTAGLVFGVVKLIGP